MSLLKDVVLGKVEKALLTCGMGDIFFKTFSVL